MKKLFGEAAFNHLYVEYQGGARKRGISWELTKEQFRELTSSPCYYTGRLPSQIKRAAGGDYIYNGVDRLDSSKGYTVDNCVPCIGRVNEMKMDSAYEEFIELCRAVVKCHDAKRGQQRRLQRKLQIEMPYEEIEQIQ